MKIITKFCVAFFLVPNNVARVLVCLCSLVLMLSGDVEINTVSLSKCKEYFSIYHWNLNSMYIYDYFKLLILKAYIFDIICLSETYLDSTTATDVTNYKFPGTFWFVLTILVIQNMEESVFLKECLTVKSYKYWLFTRMSEFELQISYRICNFVALDRSQSQSQDDLETFAVLNVLSNFIPHKTILWDDKNPPLFNSQIKSLL